MGFNLNMDLNKLPHIWQTMIAMVGGGVLIGSSFMFVGKKIEASNNQQEDVIEAVESLNSRFVRVESTQRDIMDSISSQGTLMRVYNNDLKKEVNGVDSRLRYYIQHSRDMTTEQILDAFDLGYTSGFVDGKKKEMTQSIKP